jgi:hypothetical protein
MGQSVNLVHYDVVNFDPENGVLELYIHELESKISIEIPIENDRFIEGNDLLEYIAGFIPVHAIQRKKQLKTVKNADGFKQFINKINNEESLSKSIRALRDLELTKSDWTVLPDTGFTEKQVEIFKKYRQQLRDIPQQHGFPNDVIWPRCDGEWMNHPGIVSYDELND